MQILEMPVVVQRHVPLVLTVQKPVEIPQVQFLDKFVAMPVVVQRQMSVVLTVQKPGEIAQLQILDRFVDMPVVSATTSAHGLDCVKTVEVPQLFIHLQMWPTSLSWPRGRSLEHHMVQGRTPAGTGGNCEIEVFLPAEFAPPMFVTAPVFAGQYVQAAPLFEHVVLALTMEYAAPVTNMTSSGQRRTSTTMRSGILYPNQWRQF